MRIAVPLRVWTFLIFLELAHDVLHVAEIDAPLADAFVDDPTLVKQLTSLVPNQKESLFCMQFASLLGGRRRVVPANCLSMILGSQTFGRHCGRNVQFALRNFDGMCHENH